MTAHWKKRLLAGVVASVLCAVAGSSSAALHITITKGLSTARPVAIVPFSWQGGPAGAPATDIAKVVSADLVRSGHFKALPRTDMLEKPDSGDDINFANWRAVSVDDVVVGQIHLSADGYVVDFRLFDVYTEQPLAAYRLTAQAGSVRSVAHHVANLIYKALTGERGAFGTRIAYVASSRVQGQANYELVVSDADGHNAQVILSSDEPILSPSWSPDGKRIAYAAFDNHAPGIYVQTVATGQRRLVLKRPGLNGAPAFSPDGSRLAVVLSSRAGNPDIYILNLRTNHLHRVTYDRSIETEPAWLPDGTSLVYTSNRGGSAQLYEQSLDTSRHRRLTFEGSYNARAQVTSDGKHIAMVHREKNGNLHIGIMNLSTGALRILTRGRLDKSPSCAPNGSMIIYAGLTDGKYELATVSVDGHFHQTLAADRGEISDPAWGPFPVYKTQ